MKPTCHTQFLYLILSMFLVVGLSCSSYEDKRSQNQTKGQNPDDGQAPDIDELALSTKALSANVSADSEMYGFGMAGAGNWDHTSTSWFYNWGHNHPYLDTYNHFLHMHWGGPLGAQNYCYCKGVTDGCYADEATCLLHSDSCKKFDLKYGMQCAPGCANRNSTSTGCDIEDDLIPHTDPLIDLVENHKGRTWLIFNEPDDWNQSWMKPREAAKLYKVIHERVKQVDPTAKLFCCGTHPGNTPEEWMVRFFEEVEAPIDGIHMHNYYKDDYFSGQKIIETMEKFSDKMAAQVSKYGQHMANVPILVSEWSGLSGGNVDKCSGMNNRNNVMRPVKNWFVTKGLEYRYIGAAWYASQAGDNSLTEEIEEHSFNLYERLLNGSVERTCLGDEYVNYNWPNIVSPCKKGEACNFDTHSFRTRTRDGAEMMQATTGGRLFKYKITSGRPLIFSKLLTTPSLGYMNNNSLQGPCVGKTGTQCHFDTYVFRNNAAGEEILQISAYGKLYKYKVAGNQLFSVSELKNDPAFSQSNGVCKSAPAGTTCRIDTHTFRIRKSDGREIMQVTAYGKLFKVALQSGLPVLSVTDLTHASLGYGWNNGLRGPCVGKTAGSCKFNTHTFRTKANGVEMEQITADGKMYKYEVVGHKLVEVSNLDALYSTYLGD